MLTNEINASTQGDYLEWIKRAFSERCKHNPRYSLRAFARDLKLSPATLSYVMNGQKGLSMPVAQSVAASIGLNEKEAEIFCCLVESKHGRSKTARTIAQARLAQLEYHPKVATLQLDVFQTIADWYHLAILQLVQVKKIDSDTKWMANQLGIQVFEVETAIERLKRLELLLVDDGHYRVSKEMVFAPDGVPSDAIRKFHRQVLEKAMQSISDQTIDERYLNTTLLPVKLSDLPQAKEKIRKFHREFDAEFTPRAQDPGDHVYALAVQFFSLTPKLK